MRDFERSDIDETLKRAALALGKFPETETHKEKLLSMSQVSSHLCGREMAIFRKLMQENSILGGWNFMQRSFGLVANFKLVKEPPNPHKHRSGVSMAQ